MESCMTNEEYTDYLKTKGISDLLDIVDGEYHLVRRFDGKHRLIVTETASDLIANGCLRPVYFEDSPEKAVIDAILWQKKREGQ